MDKWFISIFSPLQDTVLTEVAISIHLFFMFKIKLAVRSPLLVGEGENPNGLIAVCNCQCIGKHAHCSFI